MNIPRVERETNINFNEAESTAVVFTYNGALIRKLNKLCKEYPDLFKLLKRDIEGAYTYEIPKRYIKINQPRSKALTNKAL